MTVNTEIARIAHDGDGASQTFAVQFYFLQDADLTVYVGGLKQTITTGYTVSGAGNPSGGSVTVVVAPPSGSGNVVIIRDPDQLQSTKYPANDPFPAKTHETALDKLTMLVQRTRDLITSAFALSDADSSGASLVVPAPQAGFLLGWNPTPAPTSREPTPTWSTRPSRTLSPSRRSPTRPRSPAPPPGTPAWSSKPWPPSTAPSSPSPTRATSRPSVSTWRT